MNLSGFHYIRMSQSRGRRFAELGLDLLQVGRRPIRLIRFGAGGTALLRGFARFPALFPDKAEQPFQVFSAEKDVNERIQDHVEGRHSAGVEIRIVVLLGSTLIHDGADLKTNEKEL